MLVIELVERVYQSLQTSPQAIFHSPSVTDGAIKLCVWQRGYRRPLWGHDLSFIAPSDDSNDAQAKRHTENV